MGKKDFARSYEQARWANTVRNYASVCAQIDKYRELLRGTANEACASFIESRIEALLKTRDSLQDKYPNLQL